MIRVISKDSAALVAELMARDVVTSNREKNISASIHFYNTYDDADAVVSAPAEGGEHFARG